MIKSLRAGLEKLDIIIEEEKILKLISYAEMLKEKNKIVNLTAIKDDLEIIEKHFLDSLILHKFISQENNKKAIDIGTGAGFPGMVLAIVNPQIEFSLLDSIGKKTKFLEEVAQELEIKNVKIINKRAEDFIKEKNERESYDFGFARAVAEIRILNEFVLPFLKKDAVFLSQKVKYEEELKNAENSFKILCGEVVSIEKFSLPFSNDDRVIITIKKNDATLAKYPRKAGAIEKNPL